MKKKLLAGFLALAMVVSGIVVAPKQADAADDAAVKYVATKVTTEEDAVVIPEEAGYLFGGWYSDAAGTKVLESVEAGQDVYAKMVPDYVLTIKTQITANTTEDSETTSMRLISSVDSKNYKKVGFKVWLANNEGNALTSEGSTVGLETTKVYSGLYAGPNRYEAKDLFGDASALLSVWRLDNIAKVNFKKIINIQPYWVTMDGTTVMGSVKFAHVEDSYEGLVSIPINLTTGELVAAGALALKYDAAKLSVYDVECGNVFPEKEMAYNDDEAGTIKFVGNAATVNENVTADDIYANVRFTKDTDAKLVGELTFTVNGEDFCNWAEEDVDVLVEDIKY